MEPETGATSATATFCYFSKRARRAYLRHRNALEPIRAYFTRAPALRYPLIVFHLVAVSRVLRRQEIPGVLGKALCPVTSRGQSGDGATVRKRCGSGSPPVRECSLGAVAILTFANRGGPIFWPSNFKFYEVRRPTILLYFSGSSPSQAECPAEYIPFVYSVRIGVRLTLDASPSNPQNRPR